MMRELWIRNYPYAAVGFLSIGAALLISIQLVPGLRAQTDGASSGIHGTGANGQNGSTHPNEAGGDADSVSDIEGFLEPFIYDIVNRRDPFLPFAEYEPGDDTGPLRPLSPAQRFDLDQLKLVGIIWDVKDPRAMFLDPEKEVLILGRDEGIGNRNGYIAAIREGEVVVVEATRRRGEIIYKTRVLRIER